MLKSLFLTFQSYMKCKSEGSDVTVSNGQQVSADAAQTLPSSQASVKPLLGTYLTPNLLQQQPMQSAQPMLPVQAAQSMQPVQLMQPMQTMETMQPMQTMQTMQTMQPMQTMQTMQPMQTMQTMQMFRRRRINWWFLRFSKKGGVEAL